MREGTRHRLAFKRYLELGADRSLERLRDQLRADPNAHGLRRVPGLRTLARWSAAFHWQARIAEFEREARQREAEAYIEGLLEMNQRHVQLGLALQEKAVRRLQAMDDAELAPRDVIRGLLEGMRMERLARGEVTDRTAIERTHDDGLDGFSPAELRGLARLAAERAQEARRPGDRDPSGVD